MWRNTQVLDKKEVSKRVQNLPEGFTEDPKKQVTSTADIPASKAGTDVLNIIDTETGVSEIYAKERKLPFMEFENQGEIGIRAGLSDAGREIDVYMQKDFIRVGGFHLGGYLEGSYRPDHEDIAGWKAMVTLSRPW